METFIDQIQQTSLVEWLGTATGLIGVYLSIKEKVLAWPFFILCYGLYVYLSYSASLYAAMTLNACFIPIAIYGWRQWSRVARSGQTQEAESGVHISSLRGVALIWTLAIAIIGTLGVGALLYRYTEGSAPFLESFATTLSFLAQWMLSKKYLENWLVWIAADLAFLILWGSQGYWVAVTMFLVFIALAVSGYMSWKKEIRTNAA